MYGYHVNDKKNCNIIFHHELLWILTNSPASNDVNSRSLLFKKNCIVKPISATLSFSYQAFQQLYRYWKKNLRSVCGCVRVCVCVGGGWVGTVGGCACSGCVWNLEVMVIVSSSVQEGVSGCQVCGWVCCDICIIGCVWGCGGGCVCVCVDALIISFSIWCVCDIDVHGDLNYYIVVLIMLITAN